MAEFVVNLISNYGYFGMFIGMVLEAVIIIIPSELILATSGILASKNIFSFWGAFTCGLIGSVFCAIVIYLMGYFGGRAFVKKYGSWDIAYHEAGYVCDENPFYLIVLTQKFKCDDKENFVNDTASRVYKIHKLIHK